MIDTSGRLFTFGCSITNYKWPTWADIAGTKWNHFENYGEEGAGNYFIFNSVIECDIKNNLTPKDMVVIMWSGIARHDNYIENRWNHAHNIFSRDNELAHSPDGYWRATFSYIYAVEQFLQNRGIPYIMANWIDYSKFDSPYHRMYEKIWSKILYIPISFKINQLPQLSDIDKITNILYNDLSGPDWPNLESIKTNQYSTTPEIEREIENFWNVLKNDPRVKLASKIAPDYHPLPSEHLKIAKKIFPTLEFDSNTEQWVNYLDRKIKNGEYIGVNEFKVGEKL